MAHVLLLDSDPGTDSDDLCPDPRPSKVARRASDPAQCLDPSDDRLLLASGFKADPAAARWAQWSQDSLQTAGSHPLVK